MQQSEIFIKILLTIIFGAILGLETETRQKESNSEERAERVEKGTIGGVRTYTILSLFGGLAGLLFSANQLILVYILFTAVILLILAAYILNVQIKHAFGLTTELSVIIAFTLGFLTTSSIIPLAEVLVILVMLAFFLSQKRGIGALIDRIEHKEIIDVVKFALVALVILPALPDTNFSVANLISGLGIQGFESNALKDVILINPFKTWFIVVVVSGINLLGYVLSKFFGKNRGLFLTAIFGGLVSSTSATISFAAKSKTRGNENNSTILAGASIISTAVSFISMAFLIAISSKVYITALIFLLLFMLIGGFAVGIYFLRDKKSMDGNPENFDLNYEPFSIWPAVKFVSFVVVINLVVQVLQFFKVNEFFVVAFTALSGVTGMDAASIAFSGLVQNGIITTATGILAFVLANAINFGAKVVYGYIGGSKEFFKKLMLGLFITAVLGLIGLLVTI